jgi:hypothetical protein
MPDPTATRTHSTSSAVYTCYKYNGLRMTVERVTYRIILSVCEHGSWAFSCTATAGDPINAISERVIWHYKSNRALLLFGLFCRMENIVVLHVNLLCTLIKYAVANNETFSVHARRAFTYYDINCSSVERHSTLKLAIYGGWL